MKFVANCVRGRRLLMCKVGLLLSCVLIIGCKHEPGSDRPRGDSTVTITYDGKPIFGVQVNLDNFTTGEAAGGFSNADGVALLGNVVRGTYRVTLQPPISFPKTITDTEKATIKAQDWNTILPRRFRRLKSTKLRLDVKENVTEYSFDLKNEE